MRGFSASSYLAFFLLQIVDYTRNLGVDKPLALLFLILMMHYTITLGLQKMTCDKDVEGILFSSLLFNFDVCDNSFNNLHAYQHGQVA
jgi:hypothetical protein